MGNLANGIAAVAAVFSGSKKKLSPLNIWASVKCPNELL